MIDRYKLLEQIGEGGMGAVFMAQQNEPIRRRVAVKLIKAGMDSREVIARFEAERQSLSMMGHPNIAHVLDAGTTAEGRPYFVMELVRGVPITEFCGHSRLTTRERLELFVDACRGVQHAHQKGIIHRDLKPSNILITMDGDRPIPKVVDFGISKALSQELTEKTLFTAYGQMVGTPLYMSPEQAQFSARDMDTRSDVYSLGVLLYELLTDTTPFDRETLHKSGFEEMQRMICEVNPPRPSYRISTLKADLLSTVSQKRQVDPRKLSTSLRGELDWIVMKALEKERGRRYESVAAFAQDVQRHLDGQPVEACPPSKLYRLKKFSSRYRGLVTAVALIVVLLAGGLTGTTWQAFRATRAEQLAQKEAAIARAVNTFINEDLLAQANPLNETDRDIRLREVLDRAAQTIDERFRNEPLTEAAIRETLGKTYQSLGDYDQAERHLRRAETLRKEELGSKHADTLTISARLGNVVASQARFEEAEAIISQTLTARRQLLGEEHADTLASMGHLADLARERGYYTEAKKQLSHVLQTSIRVHGKEDQATLAIMNSLALVEMNLGRHAEAEQLHSEVLEILRRVLGQEHPATLGTINNLGLAVKLQGRYGEAEKLFREAYETMQRVLGDAHPSTLAAMTNLAEPLTRQGREDEAEQLLRRALEVKQETLGPEHPDTLRAANNLALRVGFRGEYSEAEKMFREVLEVRRSILGEDHDETLGSMKHVAHCLSQQGRHPEAEGVLRKSLEIQRVRPEDHPRTYETILDLADVLRNQGQYEEAEKLFRDGIKVARGKLGDDHPLTLLSMSNLAKVVGAQGRFREV